MSRSAIAGYAAAAADLVPRFEAIDCDALYAPVAHLFPPAPARIVDIGAATGRDAAWFAEKGHDVLAVEPVAAFREAGAAAHPAPSIAWLDDMLPDLTQVRARTRARGEAFDLVLVSGVWQHVPPDDRRRAMPVLAALLASGGVVIVSLRHGPGAPDRPVFQADPDDTIRTAEANGLRLVHRSAQASVQPQNIAAGVTWTLLAFARDG